MANRKNLCAMIPTEMHDRVSREREKLGMTNSDYVLKVLTEYYDMMENGGTKMAANEKMRTLAFPVSEELFQRVKRYLERETARTGQKLTQKDFVIGLIEAKLEEADREDAEAARNAEAADAELATEELDVTENEDGGNSENGEATEDSQPADAEPTTEKPEDTESENGETTEDNT